MKKIYNGIRHHNRYPETRDAISVTVSENDTTSALSHFFPKKASYDCPLDWGHNGFGATNLAYSILADHCSVSPSNPDSQALPRDLVVAFRDLVVNKFSYTSWEIEGEEVQEFIEAYAEAELEKIEEEMNLQDDEHPFLERIPLGSLSYREDFDEYRGADS